jgi:Uma2 family endonuclease
MAKPSEIERLTAPHIITPKVPHRSPLIPPLEPGDQLTRDEFERRYDAMSHLKKAELLEGVVHIPSPVHWKRHASPHASIIGWLYQYSTFTPGVEVGDNGSVRLDMDNEPQPDAAMIIEPSRGGQVQISLDDYVVGAPELVAEVAASSVNIDLTTKLRVYRRNEVREYLVWRVLEQSFDWFVLRNSQYERLSVDEAGFYQSEVFPGLWLDATALTRFDSAAVLQGLQKGLASPEHAAFVAKLDQAAARTS